MNIPFYKLYRLFVAAIIIPFTAWCYGQNTGSVKAQLDVAHTIQNQSILIDVLSNDIEDNSLKTISLKDVVLENHGTATIENGKIRFIPNPDFKGTSLINYTVCNDANVCDCGLVMVDVADAITPIYQEINLFVIKDNVQSFIMPIGFDLENQDPRIIDKPINISGKPGQWKYTPTPFTDYNTFRFVKTDTDGSKNI